MIIGVALGIVIAVMRLSDNPILRWGRLAVHLVLPLGAAAGAARVRRQPRHPVERGSSSGCPSTGRSAGCSASTISTCAWAVSTPGTCWPDSPRRCSALALSEAAYMAEIVRAGIQSVDPGQTEAAQALGMTRGQVLRRIVLPQAMRVIVPPTGNETIAMLKDTSLVIFVPVTYELFYQLSAIGNRTFKIIPMYVAATLWYLALTSVLLVDSTSWSGISRAATDERRARSDCGTSPPSRLACRAGAVGDRRAGSRPTRRPRPAPSGPWYARRTCTSRSAGSRCCSGIDLDREARRGVLRARARPARASRRSCAASTTWRRSTPAGSGWTASSSATASAAASCTSCGTGRSPRSAGTSAWCSSGSTSSRT